MATASPQHFLFDPISRWCSLGLHTCQASDTAEAIAQKMHQLNLSSLLVEEGGVIVGIVTDRDLRNKVVGAGLAPRERCARELMTSPVITLPLTAPLHQALLVMARKGIHRVVVSDETGRPVGVLSQSDLLKTQRHSPHLLALEIEWASSLAALADHYQAVRELVPLLVRNHTPIEETVAVIAFLNDALMRRVVEITAAEHGIAQERFAFVVLGSQGRGEQTLVTDQDNGLILDDALTEGEADVARAFGEAVSTALLDVGFPPCPGNIMTRNPAWTRRLGEWRRQLTVWVHQPTPEHLLQAAMFADLRALCGNEAMTESLRETLYELAASDTLFLARLAQNSLRFPPPLGWFGRIKTRQIGDIRQGVDLKKAGIFAITDGIRTLSLQHRTLQGNTFDRIRRLGEIGVLPATDARDLASALAFMLDLRLRTQVGALDEGGEPGNVVDLKTLSRLERYELQAALQTVGRLHTFLRLHFHLDLLRN
jgi:CBS domain-containing protein